MGSKIAFVAAIGPNFSRYYTDRGTTATGGRISDIFRGENGDIEVWGFPDCEPHWTKFLNGEVARSILAVIPASIALVEYYADDLSAPEGIPTEPDAMTGKTAM